MPSSGWSQSTSPLRDHVAHPSGQSGSRRTRCGTPRPCSCSRRCRTERASIFKIGFLTNHLVLVGIAVELTLLSLLIYVPFLQEIFHTGPIGLREWAYVFAWTPVIFLADEVRKALLRWLERRRGTSSEVLSGGEV